MGLQDRDYSRYGDQEERWWGGGGSRTGSGSPWSPGGTGTSMTVALIIINVAIFFLDMVFSGNGGQGISRMAEWFEVRGDTIVKPWQWYRLLTYGFVHDRDDIWHVAFNMLGLFIFGRSVEQRVGRKEFLWFYLAGVVLGGLVASLRWAGTAVLAGESILNYGPPTIGASGAVMAVTILFAFYYPHVNILLMMIFPIKAWLLAVLFVLMNLFGLVGGGGRVAYEVHLAGAAWAAAYHLLAWKLEPLIPTQWPQWGELLKRRAPRLRLHDPEKKMAQQEEEVDRILAKIVATGLDSLTSTERRTLERHSKLKRQQRTP